MKIDLPVKYNPGPLFSSQGRICKNYCIQNIDTPIIDKFTSDNFGTNTRSLNYLGLSGASLTDLKNWGKYICKGVSIEHCTNVYHQQIRSLFSEVQSDIADPSSVHIVQGNMDELLNPTTNESLWKSPLLKDFDPFTLVNLDYYGTIVNTTSLGTMKRVELLKEFFKLQWDKKKGLKYLLLLTVYHAGKEISLGTDESQLIKKIRDYSHKYEEIADAVIDSNDRIAILSLAIPLFVAEAASASHTLLTVRRKVTYRDTAYNMVHFVFELECRTEQSPEIKRRNIYKDVKLEKIEVVDGNPVLIDY